MALWTHMVVFEVWHRSTPRSRKVTRRMGTLDQQVAEAEAFAHARQLRSNREPLYRVALCKTLPALEPGGKRPRVWLKLYEWGAEVELPAEMKGEKHEV